MMNPEHGMEEAHELAALYAAGAMTPDESLAFEVHLAKGCASCLDELTALAPVVEVLASAVQPIAPSSGVKATVMSRIHAVSQDAHAEDPTHPQVWREWDTDPLDRMFIRKAESNPWEDTGVQGVRVRRIFVDHERNEMTALVRMEPGSAYPRHIHNGAEQCLVLEGDLDVGADILRSGDYQRLPAGTQHPVQSTKGGCLLMIVSSLTDEMV